MVGGLSLHSLPLIYMLSPWEIQHYMDDLNFTPGNMLNLGDYSQSADRRQTKDLYLNPSNKTINVLQILRFIVICKCQIKLLYNM